MLILHLDAVARGPVRVQGEIPADDPLWDEAGVELAGPLKADLEARSVGSGSILVRGPIHVRIAAECRRCLVPVEREISDTIDLFFEPLATEERDELSGEVYPLPTRGTELSLAEPIREQVLLRVPEYVVCREECRGLCAHCGTNRNEASCDCVPERAGSPWDALKNIKFD